ncbi:hypothetical protein BD626DRAFT_579014 [Schizophyllum amplum]|uniref:Uncharacterized protein n=1 Tax=Schizophyllum amplum TaxID=97359 RepID=A0A550BRR0_9AGAR|nr:hypothetical protein BD626DRAFT_579014 [Auriculariopsis ampla]
MPDVGPLTVRVEPLTMHIEPSMMHIEPPTMHVAAAAAQPSESRPPRSRTCAADDLAFPSPVPSLAKVLKDGTMLENQRAQRQDQATGSLFNNACGFSLAGDGKAKQKKPEPPADFDFGLGSVWLGHVKVYDQAAIRKKNHHRVQNSNRFPWCSCTVRSAFTPPSQDGLRHPYAAAHAGAPELFQRLVAKPRPN